MSETPRRILVVNPNSNQTVTAGLHEALQPLRFAGGPIIDTATLTDGPRGIESQVHTDAAATSLQRFVDSPSAAGYDAYVVACFSDPGLHALREKVPLAFGIAEAGIGAALNLGDSIGVVSILPNSLPRHARYFRSLGLQDRIAGDLAINARVEELADEQSVRLRLESTAERLIEDHGADVIVLGCAGMARYREPLQRHLGVPVVDPTQAAACAAIAAVSLGYRRA